MKELEKKVYDEYLHIGIRQCKECQECCKAELLNNGREFYTTGIWVVGDNYPKNRVLFVGKVARGKGGGKLIKNNDIYDCTESSRGLWKNNWAYWSYTREICEKVFNKSESIENIAFTNIIKCNSSDTTDKTTFETKEYCIKKVQVFRKELLQLQPHIIVFYTGKDYDNYIFEEGCIFDTIKSGFDYDNRIPIGRKRVPWLEAEAELDHTHISLLRTGHPERLNKSDFVDKVSDWIKKEMASRKQC